ncbi:GNAT family N-acetyltransferase [Acholeplasma equifetale]|uniref:GNAT family N-acetyltransferase n=1 Tax=Acholeplasma equifetale TaxID=264634 RepID=UPI00047B7D59|nr:GNAT family N-acetyltransferase [Acholeplasma equifetale]
MEYRLIDKKNPPKELFELHLNENQKTYLDSVDVILKDYKDLDNWKVLSIHLDNETRTMIGFAVIGLFNDEAWIDDIMIDLDYQGHGYGKRSLLYLIGELMLTYHKNEVYLSCFEYNTFGLKFYDKLGFKQTDRKDINGEIILVYKK